MCGLWHRRRHCLSNCIWPGCCRTTNCLHTNHCAVEKRWNHPSYVLQILEMLLERGAGIEATGSPGTTALHAVVNCRALDVSLPRQPSFTRFSAESLVNLGSLGLSQVFMWAADVCDECGRARELRKGSVPPEARRRPTKQSGLWQDVSRMRGCSTPPAPFKSTEELAGPGGLRISMGVLVQTTRNCASRS